MELEHYSENDIEFVRLPKKMLMADAKQTKKFLHSLIGRARPRLALDMSAVEYIDSSGLAVLVNCLQTSRRKSGDVCLFGMQDTVRTLFELTRLHNVFPIEERLQDAALRLSA